MQSDQKIELLKKQIEELEADNKALLRKIEMQDEVNGGRTRHVQPVKDEAYLESILLAVPTGIGLIVNRQIIKVNKKICEMTGYTEDELLGQSARIFYPTEQDFNFVGTEKYRQIRELGMGTVETRWQKKNGEIIDILMSSRPIDPADLGKGLTFTALDISERKKSEIQAREHSRNLDTVFNNVNEAQVLWKVEKDGLYKIVAMNDRYEFFVQSILPKLKKEDFLGLDLRAVTDKLMVNDELYEKTLKLYARVLEKREPLFYTEEFPAPHGVYYAETSIIPIVDENDQLTHMLFSTLDITERKQAELALKSSEEKFRSIFEYTNIGVALGDTSGRILDANSEFLRMLKYDIEEIKGKHFVDFTHPDDADSELDKVKGLLEGEIRSYRFEKRYVDKEGNIVWVDLSVTGRLNNDGKIDAFIGMVKDITEQVRNRESVREYAQKLELALQSADEGMWEWHLDTKKIFLDDGALAMLDYKPGEIANNEDFVLDHIHPDEKQEILHIATQYLQGSLEKYDVEFKLRCKNGTYKWIWSVGKVSERDHQGKPLRFIGVHRDISEKKAVEESIKRSEEKFRSYVQFAPDGIFIADHQGKYHEVNPAACKITGYTEEELLQMSVPELIQAEYQHKAADHFRNVQTKGFASGELGFMTKEGEKRFWEVEAVRLSSDRFLGFVKDTTSKRVIEESLLQSKNRFSSLVNHLQTGVFYIDIQGNILEANPALIRILGSPSIEAAKKINIFNFKPLIDFGYSARLNECVQTKQIVSGEGIYTSKWNKKFYVYYYFVPLLQDDEVIGVLANIEDISNRKQMELDLKESELFAHAVANSTPALIYIYGVKEEKNIYSNHKHSAFYKKLGLEGGKLDMQNFMELVHPEDFKRQIEGSFKMIENPEINRFRSEIRLKSHNGWRWMAHDVSVFKSDEEGKATQLLGALFDIHDRKKAEQSLKESEERFKKLHNASFGGITIHDKGLILDCNKGLSNITGFSYEELIGMDGLLLISEKSRELVMSNILAEYEKPYEAIGLRKNGEEYPLRLEARMIRSEGKKVRVVEFRDITEQKAVEKELLKAKEKAEESDRLKSAFLANMSHEIRTPMNGIMGFSQLLKEPELSGDQQLKYINIIQKSGERMLNIINDLIDISKIEAGQVEIYLSDTDVHEQTTFLANFFRPEATQKGLAFRSVFPDQSRPLIVNTDQEKLYAILANLLKNAVKYTHEGSIEFGYATGDEYLRFYVKDTGIGVPEDRRLAIFERFVQADIEDTKALEGAGLGLAISQAYAKMLGGALWMEPNSPFGSCFILEIPAPEGSLQPLHSSEKTMEQAIKTDSLKDAVILIAEDEDTSVMYMNEILKKRCQNIMYAISGREAVETVREHPEISLILMDIKMPEMDGYEASRKIREFNKDVLIIAQTAFALQGDREKALQAGCDDYITKPVGKADMLELIDRHLSKKK